MAPEQLPFRCGISGSVSIPAGPAVQRATVTGPKTLARSAAACDRSPVPPTKPGRRPSSQKGPGGGCADLARDPFETNLLTVLMVSSSEADDGHDC
jgi:hypothetical protein